MSELEDKYIFRESPFGPIKYLGSFAHWDFNSDALLHVGELEDKTKVIIILASESDEYIKYNMVKITDENLIKLLRTISSSDNGITFEDIFLKANEIYSYAVNLSKKETFYTSLTKYELDLRMLSGFHIPIKEFYKTFSETHGDEIEDFIKKLEGVE